MNDLLKDIELIVNDLRDDQAFIERAIDFHKSRKEHDIYSYFKGRQIQIEQYLNRIEGIYFHAEKLTHNEGQYEMCDI